jgi:hypothetical protein
VGTGARAKGGEAGAPERATPSVALVVAAKSAQQEKKEKTFDSRLALERRVGNLPGTIAIVGTYSTEGLPVKTAKPTANYERDDHPYTTTLSGRRISFAFGGICRTSRK